MDDTTKHFHFTIHNEETLSLRSIEIATQLQDAISRVNSFLNRMNIKLLRKKWYLYPIISRATEKHMKH